MPEDPRQRLARLSPEELLSAAMGLLDAVQQEKSAKRRERTAMKSRINQLEDALASEKETTERLEGQNHRYQDETHKLKARIEQMRRELSRLRQDVIPPQIAEQLETLEAQNATLIDQIEQLSMDCTAFRTDASTARAHMLAVQEKFAAELEEVAAQRTQQQKELDQEVLKEFKDFHIPNTEKVELQLNAGIGMTQGDLYLTQNFLCWRATGLFSSSKSMFPISHIEHMQKTKFTVFNNSLDLWVQRSGADVHLPSGIDATGEESQTETEKEDGQVLTSDEYARIHFTGVGGGLRCVSSSQRDALFNRLTEMVERSRQHRKDSRYILGLPSCIKIPMSDIDVMLPFYTHLGYIQENTVSLGVETLYVMQPRLNKRLLDSPFEMHMPRLVLAKNHSLVAGEIVPGALLKKEQVVHGEVMPSLQIMTNRLQYLIDHLRQSAAFDIIEAPHSSTVYANHPRVALIADPEGNVIELVERVLEPYAPCPRSL